MDIAQAMNVKKLFMIIHNQPLAPVWLICDFFMTFDPIYYRKISHSKVSKLFPRLHFVLKGQKLLLSPSPYFSASEYVHTNPPTFLKSRYSFLHYLFNGSGSHPSTTWDYNYVIFAPEAKTYEQSLLTHAFRYYRREFHDGSLKFIESQLVVSEEILEQELVLKIETLPNALANTNSSILLNIEINIDSCDDIIFIGPQNSLSNMRILTNRKEHVHDLNSYPTNLKVEVKGPHCVLIETHGVHFINPAQIASVMSRDKPSIEKAEAIYLLFADVDSRSKYALMLRSRIAESFSSSRLTSTNYKTSPSDERRLTLRSQVQGSAKIKKILLVSHEDSRTGAPIYLNQLALELAEGNYDIQVVSLRPNMRSGVFSKLGKQHTYLEDWRSKTLRKPSILRNWVLTQEGENAFGRLLKKFNPDLVIANSLCSADIIRMSVGYSTPSMLYVHESWDFSGRDFNTQGTFQARVKESLEASNFVLFGSQATYDHWRSSNCAINGVVIPTFRSLEISKKSEQDRMRNKLRSKLKINLDSTVFLSVATFEPRKRIADIVVAFCELKVSNAYLILVGANPLQPDYKLQRMVKNCSNIFIVNSTKNLEEYYAAADCLVFASEEETMPLVLQEAAHWKIPRICSRYRGYDELIPSQDFAFLFDVGDIKALTQEMKNVISDHLTSNEKAQKAFDLQSQQNLSSFDLLKSTINRLESFRSSVHPLSWYHEES